MVGNLYNEIYRPQFHFTAKNGWLNDPNGLLYYNGEYHLFFQHNPFGINWGNMTWGHAVSTDMVHWKQLENAIEPDELGTIFSGSGVVDQKNTAGFQTGDEKALICIYTSAGGTSDASKGKPFTQSIAYSNDCGRTWVKYEKNPVIPHIVGSNRDPKVIWHEPTEKWVMALYLDGNEYMILTSPNLKDWTGQSTVHLSGAGECPDIFELPVNGDPKNKKWVFWGANSNYLIGNFDGLRFHPESNVLRAEWGANFYAAQTWSDIPETDGRKIQIAWMSGGNYPDMPFNQQMSFPCELTLRTTNEGIRLFREPISEITNIYRSKHVWNDQSLDKVFDLANGQLFDIHAEIELNDFSEFVFVIRGEKVEYNAKNKQIKAFGRAAKLEPINNRVKLRLLIDRTSVEVFCNNGIISMSSCFLPDPSNDRINLCSSEGKSKIVSLIVYELDSTWQI
ncbi:MAG: glycoside hydrolase family 32 protein [bacterium]